MEPREQEILEEIFAVKHIADPDIRRQTVQDRYERMTKIEQMEINMRLGRKLAEAQAQMPGALYSPPTWTLIITMLLFLILSALAMYIILDTHILLVAKFLVGVLGVVWFFTGVRGAARIIYRTANGRDF